MNPTPDTLPPLSGVPALLPPGRPASAWLGAGRGQCAHHFPAGHRTSACGRTVPARALRLAWLAWAAPSRPHCHVCARRLGVE